MTGCCVPVWWGPDLWEIKPWPPVLLRLLFGTPSQVLTADLITALSGLEVSDFNDIVMPYLTHAAEEIRKAALGALDITDEAAFTGALMRVGDVEPSIRTPCVHPYPGSTFSEQPYCGGIPCRSQPPVAGGDI